MTTVNPPMDDTAAPKVGKSRLISSVLGPAIRLWLRSQVEQVEELQVTVVAGDRQILTGTIPEVRLSAQKAVYQGLHLSQIALKGQNIRANLGQVIRGQALRLLEPISLTGSLQLHQTDLQASLDSPLLRSGVLEFLRGLLQAGGCSLATEPGLTLGKVGISLGQNTVSLDATLIPAQGEPFSVGLTTGLQMADPHTLELLDPRWLENSSSLPLQPLASLKFDLGAETRIQTLVLTPEQLSCEGQIAVLPD